MKHIQAVVIGVIRHNDKYLLTKRIHEHKDFHDKWQLPGGGLEWGESLETGLKRELKEELNATLASITLMPYIYNAIRPDWHGLLIPFLCTLVDPNQKIILDHEASEYGWYTTEEVKHLTKLKGLDEILEVAEKIAIL